MTVATVGCPRISRQFVLRGGKRARPPFCHEGQLGPNGREHGGLILLVTREDATIPLWSTQDTTYLVEIEMVGGFTVITYVGVMT